MYLGCPVGTTIIISVLQLQHLPNVCIHAISCSCKYNAFKYMMVLVCVSVCVIYPSLQLLSVTSSSTNSRRSNPPKVTPSTPVSHSQSPALPTTPSSSSIGDTSDGIASRKRGLTFDADINPKRRRSSTYNSRQTGDKSQNKGLRHFSQRVCEKVRDKGTTTYNEVSRFVYL